METMTYDYWFQPQMLCGLFLALLCLVSCAVSILSIFFAQQKNDNDSLWVVAIASGFFAIALTVAAASVIGQVPFGGEPKTPKYQTWTFTINKLERNNK